MAIEVVKESSVLQGGRYKGRKYSEFHVIYSSRKHRGAINYRNEDAALTMRNELSRGRREWAAHFCEEHEGWHLKAANQYFRSGR